MSFRNLASMIALMLLTIFIVQNFALVSVSFLLWEITLPRSIILLVVFMIGMLTGMIVSQRSRPKNNSG